MTLRTGWASTVASGMAFSIFGCHGAGNTPSHGPIAPGLTGGFVDLTTAVENPAPFPIVAGDRATNQEPEAAPAFFIDRGTGSVQVVMAPAASITGNLMGRHAMVYQVDPVTHTLDPVGPLLATGDAPVAGAMDLDGDGNIDLLTRQGHGDVAWGAADGTFSPPTPLEDPPPSAMDWAVGALYLDDLDGDGWTDMLVGNRFCNATATVLHPMLRTGVRTWVHRPDLIVGGSPVSVYSVLSASFHPGEKTLAAFGLGCVDMNAPTFYTAGSAPGPDGYPRFAPFNPIPDGAYYGSFHPPQPPMSQFTPMAADVGDVNGDGLLDLFVSLDPFFSLFDGRPARPFADGTERSGMSLLPVVDGAPMIPWGGVTVDLDQDGRPDVVVAHGNDPSAWFNPSSFIGPQWVVAAINQGNGNFVDVTSRVALGRHGQWRALTVGDLDGDGDPDVAVGGSGELPRVYRNDLVTTHHGFALRLRGTTSNALGMGAVVLVTPDGASTPQTFVVHSPVSPDVLQEPLVFAGLGNAMAARVQVTWPSGTVQDVGELPAGAVHTIAEPPVLALAPTTRHAPADGHSTITLTVTPRAPDGSIDTSTDVMVAVVYGAGAGQTVALTPLPTGGFTAQLLAPTAPGSSVIEVRIHGVPLGVHPRVWWD